MLKAKLAFHGGPGVLTKYDDDPRGRALEDSGKVPTRTLLSRGIHTKVSA